MLVVTIVVLIVLATISINAVLGENGLIQKAEKASQMQANAEESDQGAMGELDQVIANKLSGASNGEETPTIDPALNPIGTIPEGAVYFNLSTKAFYYDSMPEFASEADCYIYGDYIYTRLKDGWGVTLFTEAEETLIKKYFQIELNVKTSDNNQTTYGVILESINGKYVMDMNRCFSGCSFLTSAPVIPNSVTGMNGTFWGCTSLTNSPEIPSSVTDMSYTFYGCKSLTGTVTVNANPSLYEYCFAGVDMTKITLAGLCDATVKQSIANTGDNEYGVTIID